MLQEAIAAGGSSEHSQPPNGLQNGPEQLPPPPSGQECISRQIIAPIRAASRLVSHRVNQRVVTHGDAAEGTHVAGSALFSSASGGARSEKRRGGEEGRTQWVADSL